MLGNYVQKYKEDDKFKFHTNIAFFIAIAVFVFYVASLFMDERSARTGNPTIESSFFGDTEVSDDLKIAGMEEQIRKFAERERMGAKVWMQEANAMKQEIQKLHNEKAQTEIVSRNQYQKLREEMEQRFLIREEQSKKRLDQIEMRIPEDMFQGVAKDEVVTAEPKTRAHRGPRPISPGAMAAIDKPQPLNPYSQYADGNSGAQPASEFGLPPSSNGPTPTIGNTNAGAGDVEKKPFNAIEFSDNKISSLRIDPKEAAKSKKNVTKTVGLTKDKNGNTIAKGAEEAEAEKKEQIYYPSTTVIPAITVSGLDAPAGLQSNSDPHPMLLRVKKEAILPNKYRANFKDCKILATGYGELSTSRAYIRTEKLACITVDGGVIDIPLDGYVSGEDGKPGLAGDIVNREGALFLRTGFAGFLEGIAQAFEPQQVPVIADQSDGETFYNKRATGDILSVAGFNGISKSMESLSDYYLQYLDQMFPVVEIKPNRQVDITLTSGLRISL